MKRRDDVSRLSLLRNFDTGRANPFEQSGDFGNKAVMLLLVHERLDQVRLRSKCSEFRCCVSAVSLRKRLRMSASAVSYTHLDVYKRQALQRRWRWAQQHVKRIMEQSRRR